MATGKLRIVDTVATAWRDAFEAIGRMPGVVGVTFVIMLALSAVGLLMLPVKAEWGGISLQLMSFLLGVVQSFLLTPFAIAVHRYVLLGEIAPRYVLEASSPRFRRFFGFAVTLSAVWMLPSLLATVATAASALTAAMLAALSFILFVVAVVVSLRNVILFPAIAVEAPGAQWQNAMRDTKGQSWRVLVILVVTALPAVIVAMPAYWLLIGRGGPALGSGLAYVILQAVVQIPTLCAFAAVASHLFRFLADSLARPVGSAVPGSSPA